MKLRIGDKVITPWRMHWLGTQVIGGGECQAMALIASSDHVDEVPLCCDLDDNHPELHWDKRQQVTWAPWTEQGGYTRKHELLITPRRLRAGISVRRRGRAGELRDLR